MIHPERKLVDTRDKISFSLPKTLEAKEEQIREQTISISCCCCAFQPPLFSKSKCVFFRGFCRRARMRARRIDRAFASRSGLCSFETNTRSIIIACTRRSAKRESFATELQTKKQKKTSLGVPRTKTSRVFGRPFLRWTRRSRSKFAKPISRNVVASSFRSWRPTLSRSCGWTGR